VIRDRGDRLARRVDTRDGAAMPLRSNRVDDRRRLSAEPGIPEPVRRARDLELCRATAERRPRDPVTQDEDRCRRPIAATTSDIPPQRPWRLAGEVRQKRDDI
jgi:hypothetical protein